MTLDNPRRELQRCCVLSASLPRNPVLYRLLVIAPSLRSTRSLASCLLYPLIKLSLVTPARWANLILSLARVHRHLLPASIAIMHHGCYITYKFSLESGSSSDRETDILIQMQTKTNHLDFKKYSSLPSDYSSKSQEFSLPTHISLPERQFTDLATSARFTRVAPLQDTPTFSAGSLSPETPLNPPLAAAPRLTSDPLICSPNHYWNYFEQHSQALPQDGVDGWIPSTPMTSPVLNRDQLQFEKPALPRMRSSHCNWIPQSGFNACNLTVPREFDGSFKGLNANAAEFMSTARLNPGPFNTVLPQRPLRPNDHAFSSHPATPMQSFGPEFDLPSPAGTQWMSCGPFPRPQIFDDHARQDSAPIPLRPRSNSRSNLRFAAPRIIDDEDQPLNFLQLLQPNSRPPYPLLVARIVKKADQQASIFIQQKLKNAPAEERSRIVDAIVERGLEMMVSAEIATLGRGCSRFTNSKGGSVTGVCSGAWNSPARGRICSR